MATDKKTKLSIELTTVDKATAKIRALNDRLDKITKPTRDFRKALSELHEKSGIGALGEAFRGVGSAISGLLAKAGILGGMLGAAAFGLKSLIDDFDSLGDKAQAMGVSADWLAQMRFAADKSGVAVESLDSGMKSFVTSLGAARANSGPLVKFLGKVSPALLKQVKAAKSNEEAFDLMADAMAKIKDPAKRAIFAQKAFGDAAAAPLLAKGAHEVGKLRSEYGHLAGSQKEAVEASAEVSDSMKNMRASMDGVKAALVVGLAPAMKVIVDRLRDWFVNNRGNIAQWAKDIGERLPGAIKAAVEWLGKAWDKVKAFVDMIGGLKNAAIGVGLVIAGPLITSILKLGGALATTISRVSKLRSEMAGVAEAGGKGGGLLGKAGGVLLPIAAAKAVSDMTGGSIADVARSKGFRSDNMLDLFHEARNRNSVEGTVMRAMENARAQAQQEASISVKFENAPRGMRATIDPQSTADVDMTVGQNMLLGTP